MSTISAATTRFSRLAWFVSLSILASFPSCSDQFVMPEGKAVYIPNDMKTMNLNDPESEWSFHRMKSTPNFIIFWQKGFGNDPSQAPDLEERPMDIDLDLLEERLEYFYQVYRDSLDCRMPVSRADSVRMMVMLNYSLESTAYGGTIDDTIGAIWISPVRMHDDNLNAVAHVLSHSFQAQIDSDRKNEMDIESSFFEMSSQWMLWHVDQDWVRTEKYHYDAFLGQMHKAFMAPENQYHSPYMLQYWSDLRGINTISTLFRESKSDEDAVMVYKRVFGLTQSQFCDEMFDACRHFVGLDYPFVWKQTRAFAGKAQTKARLQKDGWYTPEVGFDPENYGFNVYSMPLSSSLEVEFESLKQEAPAGFRYGWVVEMEDGHYRYSGIECALKGTSSLALPPGAVRVWWVVMAAPTAHWRVDTDQTPSPSWPYRFKPKFKNPVEGK